MNQHRWANTLTGAALDLHKAIWANRNTLVHGNNLKESQERLRAKIIAQVTELYQNPPVLAHRYQKIISIPLTTRLLKPTKELIDWMERIKHQIKVTELTRSSLPPGQLTLKQAFANQISLQRYRHKYPP
jgi:hypothetical protein